jgi:hypothetical protein
MERTRRSFPTAAGCFFTRPSNTHGSRRRSMRAPCFPSFGQNAPAWPPVPSPLAGEGTTVWQRTRMGGGLSRRQPLTHHRGWQHRAASPAAEVGFIRFRPTLKSARTRASPSSGGRGHNNGDQVRGSSPNRCRVVASHDVKQPISFPRRNCARVFATLLHSPRNRGVGGAPRNVRVRARHPLGVP